MSALAGSGLPGGANGRRRRGRVELSGRCSAARPRAGPAALLHTAVLLPHRNSLFAAFVAADMGQSGEGIDPPYGALSDLVREVRDSRLGIYAVAEALRSLRI